MHKTSSTILAKIDINNYTYSNFIFIVSTAYEIKLYIITILKVNFQKHGL